MGIEGVSSKVGINPGLRPALRQHNPRRQERDVIKPLLALTLVPGLFAGSCVLIGYKHPATVEFPHSFPAAPGLHQQRGESARPNTGLDREARHTHGKQQLTASITG